MSRYRQFLEAKAPVPAEQGTPIEAAHVRCHVCRTRLVVGETAHDAGTGDDGAELFACDEHCTNKECTR